MSRTWPSAAGWPRRVAGRAVPDLVSPDLPTAEDTRAWGVRLGRLLRAGDLVVLTGGLGAGKTTLTQGLAEGVGVRGPITSPTFVIARVHPSLVGGPALVHVDAYRVGGFAELDDLDLDTSLEDSVTVVEWGHGLAEDLADDRLEVTLSGEDTRRAAVQTHGDRWATADLTSLGGAA
ncbi:tRNA (adenosine(37)-N6)-threonylcarbamoyltransferase complex ATPase subunit type 1 TsaE [Pedococcus bigeumensis]|uniref:tRNA threonylcarbamoyladenosine biosynthesis protein TsaE n=1 Tax=Pedococcus bigeumensis TaxID=433644 RepID=A0A502D1P6_9MICO|nr:tRNA (adenosine(37)-N6)-threonylcarbamoyltransferase complex ATPase subunit type 1 TsaE [Pedococcus bigeumensis]